MCGGGGEGGFVCVCFGGPTVWSSIGSSVNMAAQVKGEIEWFQ